MDLTIFLNVTLSDLSTKLSLGADKRGMSLRNGMWHGLQNDIIMRNLIYGKWRKERASNRFAGPFITAIKARLKLKHNKQG